MKRENVPAVLAVVTALTFIGACGVAEADEPEATATAEAPCAEGLPRAYARPAHCIALPAALVYGGAPRAYRRAPLPGVGVYVGPRAVYPGTLAPWGSLPAGFYAASYPLAYHMPPDAGYFEQQFGEGVGPYRTDSELPASPPHASARPNPSPDPFAREVTPPLTGPEPIPAPQPMDVPKPDGAARSGGVINAVPPRSVPRVTAPKSSPAQRPETGPREF